MKKRILSMLLVLMMLLSIMPTAAFAEETADNVTYSYEDGVLTVSGTGTCTNEWVPLATFDEYGAILTEVIIKDGITAIDEYAFRAICTELKSVKIANTVTEIGQAAFEGCTKLENINIPSGVKKIASHTFANCSSLKSITIPDSVTTIGNEAFLNCTSLTEVNIPASVTYMDFAPFGGCTSLKAITVDPENAEFFEKDGVLFGKHRLYDNHDEYEIVLYQYPAGRVDTNYTVPDDVDIIYYMAFISCANVVNINIGAKVYSIGDYAFYGCKKLAKITVDEANTHFLVKDNVLYSCSQVVDEDGTLIRLEIARIERCLPSYEGAYTIPDGVEKVSCAAFADCTKLTAVTFPASLTHIWYRAFENCSALTEITIPKNVLVVADEVFKNCVNLEKAVLEDGVGQIGNSAFAGCEKLASVSLPSTITEIDYRTFEGCKALTEIYIPDRVNQIEYSAFEGCEKLASISLPPNLTVIHDRTFGDCKSLTEIAIPNGVTEIGVAAFEGCTDLTELTIPENLKYIGGAAFGGCSSLTEIRIPGSVGEMGPSVFVDCTNLKSATIENGVESISAYMFSGCKKLENFTLPSTIKKIGQGAFSGCTTLTDVVIPDGVTYIEYATFADCSSLKNITIPASVTVIEDMIIFNDDEFANVYFGGSREQWQAAIGENNVLNAFPQVVFHYNYVAGQNHTVTNGVCSCGAYSAEHTHVYGDDNLCKYCGEQNPDTHEHDFLRGEVDTDSKGTYLTCAVDGCTARTYARVVTGKCGDNVTYTWTKFDVPGYDTLVVSGEGDMLDWGEVSPWWRGKLTTVIIEEGITRVGNMAIADRFDGDDLLTTVQLPSTLKSIGSYAFSYNENLKSIKLPNGLETIEVGAFQACNSLTSVTIPASVESIQFAAFSALPSDKLSKAYSLTQYNVAADNAYYKSVDGALYSKDGSTLVNYPAARTNTKITVPDGTAKLSDWSFSINANVETIVLPASIEDIQMGAFYGCNSLKTILFNGTREAWDAACGDKDNIAAQKINVVCLGDETSKTLTDETVDKSTTVEIKGYGDTVINSVEKVEITAVDKETAEDTLKDANIVVIGNGQYEAYDITLKNSENKEVQPNGYVQVKLSVPEDYDGSKCVVYHQGDDGTLTPVDAVFDGEYLVFITNSFSNYIIHQPHEHSFSVTTTVPSTCDKPGYTEKTCSVCNEKVKTEIPATGHNAPLTGAKDATCTEDGSTGERKCTKCKAILQIDQVIKATGHDYIDGVCTRCGSTEEIVSNGSCGDGLTWKLNSDGMLTISGSGEISGDPAWTEYVSQIKSVSIDESVTAIGENAFVDCTNLMDVYYSGTAADWSRIAIASGNDSLINAKIHFTGTVPGDLNGDGKVNVMDLIRLKRHIADGTEVVGNADVNGDGKVNVMDLIRLKRYIAGEVVDIY